MLEIQRHNPDCDKEICTQFCQDLKGSNNGVSSIEVAEARGKDADLSEYLEHPSSLRYWVGHDI